MARIVRLDCKCNETYDLCTARNRLPRVHNSWNGQPIKDLPLYYLNRRMLPRTRARSGTCIKTYAGMRRNIDTLLVTVKHVTLTISQLGECSHILLCRTLTLQYRKRPQRVQQDFS